MEMKLPSLVFHHALDRRVARTGDVEADAQQQDLQMGSVLAGHHNFDNASNIFTLQIVLPSLYLVAKNKASLKQIVLRPRHLNLAHRILLSFMAGQPKKAEIKK